MLQRRSNREGIFYWKAETASYPEFGATSYGAAPASPTIGQFIDTPSIDERNGRSKGRAAGTHLATHYILDRFERDITLTTRVTNGAPGIALWSAGIPNSTTGVLPNLIVCTGVSNRNSNAERQYNDRFCKLARWGFRVAQGSEAQLTATFMAMGRPEVATTGLLSPTYSDIVGASGIPQQFTTLTDVPLGATFNARPYITGLELSGDNSVERHGVENSLGSDVVTDRRALQLVEGPFVGTGSLSLDADIEASVIADGTAATWEEIGSVTWQIGNINIALTGFQWGGKGTQGGPVMGPMGWQVPFSYNSITLSNDA